MEKMKVYPEKGTMMCSYSGSEMRLLKYDHVGWYNGFKFVFGRFVSTSNKKYHLFEVSTRASAATPTDSNSTAILCADFSLKLGAAGGDLGRVIEKYENKHKNKTTFPIWLSTLIG